MSLSKKELAQLKADLAADAILEVGRKAIEDALIEWRDSRLSSPIRNNGLVIREKDGTASSIIRFGPEAALMIGIKAMIAHLEVFGPSEGGA